MAGGNRPVYVISIAANLAGCHPRTLRIYEEEGLLEPVRTDTNIRLYSDDDLQRVRVIRYLTQVRGVNLAGVKMLLQLRNIADMLDVFAAQRDAEIDDVQPEQIHNIGTIAEIVRVLRIPDGSAQIIVQGLQRVKISGYTPEDRYFRVRFDPIAEELGDAVEREAQLR